MKTTALIFSVLMAFDIQLAQAEALRLSEPTQQDEISETFGAPIAELPSVVELSTLLQKPDAYLGKTFSVDTKVAKVCQKKGCFFIAHQGKDSVRVAFKDYSFFVPTDIAGKEVTLVGELVTRDMTAKEADHLSKDLGEKGSISGGSVYEIVASSVRVPIN